MTTMMKRTEMDRKHISIILILVALVVGIFPCLSYTDAGISLLGVRVLDIMDETVGNPGLPIAAVFISLVFSWYLERRELSTEVPGKWFPLVFYTT